MVLVWDAPNIDMTLTQLLGRRPGSGDRPEMRALGRWLVDRANGAPVDACVFVNVPAVVPAGLQGWISFLTSAGFRVFAKPKHDGSDVDDDMVSYIEESLPDADAFVVVSNDARCFTDVLTAVAGKGKRVTVLGFAELAGEMAYSEVIEFVDLEDIPGLLHVELQRIRLDTLPEAGGWFAPRTPLGGGIESGAGEEHAPDA